MWNTIGCGWSLNELWPQRLGYVVGQVRTQRMKPFVPVYVSPCWDSTALIGEKDQWWGCGTQSLVLTVAFAPASGPFGFLVKVSPSLSGLLKPGMQEEGLFSMSLPPARCIKLWSLMRPSTWSHNCTSLHVDYWNCHLLLIILLAPCKQCIYSALWFLWVTW